MRTLDAPYTPIPARALVSPFSPQNSPASAFVHAPRTHSIPTHVLQSLVSSVTFNARMTPPASYAPILSLTFSSSLLLPTALPHFTQFPRHPVDFSQLDTHISTPKAARSDGQPAAAPRAHCVTLFLDWIDGDTHARPTNADASHSPTPNAIASRTNTLRTIARAFRRPPARPASRLHHFLVPHVLGPVRLVDSLPHPIQ
ncbi:hypothetical protein HYPSUDRAFT_204064 [Hypholoma sublateritium FD-334 SS-4]|uniref:Uncharacterized protein n=1 Tax=Hypholoma sublateritium (strain FD-334 SS-4) TaxID=945553 RepID=A0A0D2NM98_HYPSF|nr:hypothetical protein HYPSUDRAFT_204064 [Hypholoma sublateritium FD-334 SS-4]